MAPRVRWLDRRFEVLGGSLPAPIALVIAATLAASILGAQAPALAVAGALIPDYVFRGQAWRLVSWTFFEQDPLGLIFAGLALFWFGRDLARIWGPGRFLARYLGLAAAAAALTCGVALVWPQLRGRPFLGAWPVVSALIIVWARSFPTRNLLLYFVVPLSGRNLVYATLGGTLLFALLGGFSNFVPHFAAQLIGLVWLPGKPWGDLLARVKFELAYRRWRHRSSRLREVPRPAGDETTRWYH